MPNRQLPEAANDELVQMETPVIDIQDVEHQPNDGTRVNTSGVEVQPRGAADPELAAAVADVELKLDDDERAAREAVAKFEEAYGRLPPG